QRSGRRRSREEANRLAAECEESGLSQRKFSEQRGVPLKTLVRYLARYRREQRGKNQRPRWVAVEVGGKRGDGAGVSTVLARGHHSGERRGRSKERDGRSALDGQGDRRSRSGSGQTRRGRA